MYIVVEMKKINIKVVDLKFDNKEKEKYCITERTQLFCQQKYLFLSLL